MTREVGKLLVVGALALCGLVEPVAAQKGLAPFEGQLTGHLGVASGRDGRGSTVSLGGSVAVVEQSGWGAEFDFGYADKDNGRGGGLDAQSYIVNVVGMWPTGRLRPFVTAGGGVIRARTCVDGCVATTAWTDWALSGGAGVHYGLGERAAVRVDARYFTVPGQHPDPARPRGFAYWRIAAGVTYRWNIVE